MLLTKNGEELQLGDFGLSQVQAHTAKTMQTANPNGFPAYLAPELVRLPEKNSKGEWEQLKYDHKVDIWSCGAILYELFHLTLMWFKRPHDQWLPEEIIRYWIRERVLKHQHEDFSPECPAAIKRMILQCCDQSPTKRPEASELLEQATEIKEIFEAGMTAERKKESTR